MHDNLSDSNSYRVLNVIDDYRKFQRCIKQYQIRIEYIQPGKPQQNAYIKHYNRTVRYGLLNQHLFTDIAKVQTMQSNDYVFIIIRGLMKPTALSLR